MKRAAILRRDFLKRMATFGGAAAAWTLGGILPESRAFAATPSQGSAASLKIDAKAERFLSVVRGTREYRNFKSALTSPNPIDLWTDQDYQFVSFGFRTVEQSAQADRSSFQLYSALTFAASRDGAVIDVFALRPEGDGSTSTLSSLRGGETKTVTHKVSVPYCETKCPSLLDKIHAKCDPCYTPCPKTVSGCRTEKQCETVCVPVTARNDTSRRR